jgi:hypothetical protein
VYEIDLADIERQGWGFLKNTKQFAITRIDTGPNPHLGEKVESAGSYPRLADKSEFTKTLRSVMEVVDDAVRELCGQPRHRFLESYDGRYARLKNSRQYGFCIRQLRRVAGL